MLDTSDPGLLTIIKNNNDYSLQAEDNLLYYRGTPVSHISKAIIEIIKHELIAKGYELNDDRDVIEHDSPLLDILAYNLYEHPAFGDDSESQNYFAEMIRNDALFNMPHDEFLIDRIIGIKPLIDFLSQLGIIPDTTFGVLHSNKQEEQLQLFCDKLYEYYTNLRPTQKTAASYLYFHYSSLLILSLLLAGEGCRVDEYAYTATVLTNNMKVFNSSIDSDVQQNTYKQFCIDAQNIIRFLNHSIPEPVQELEELIKEGESAHLEFKSTLKINLHTGKKDDRMIHSVLKTIAAFLNSNGGMLLIGVKDDSEILGTEADGFINNDRYLLFLYDAIIKHISESAAVFVDANIQRIGIKNVCVVNCSPAAMPVYVDDEEFFVRTGPGTTKLKTSEVATFISKRWN